MTAKIGDKVIVKAYNEETDKYEPTEVVVLEVSNLQGYETVRYQYTLRPDKFYPNGRTGYAWGKPIDPNERPQTPRKGMTNGQLAAKYGISLETLREHFIDFVDNEGYTGNGKEHETFVDYLDYVCHSCIQSQEPFDGGRGAGSMGQPID